MPRVTAKQVLAVLRKRGFLLARSTGSHHVFRNAQGTRVTVPVHTGKIIHPKVMSRILKDAGITVQELEQELK